MTARYAAPVWVGPLLSPTGFGDEGRGFVSWLRQTGVPIAAQSLDSDATGLLSRLVRDDPQLVRNLHAALTAPRELSSATAIVHVPAAWGVTAPSGVAYRVCRTMWETDSLNVYQVNCLNTFDEIWVPSSHNARSFVDAGVRVPVMIVPGGVDSAVFRPDADPLYLPQARGTRFLSVFEWSHRKGPDVLLRAWADAFTSADDVTLVLRCYPQNRFGDARDLTSEVDALIAETLAAYGRRREDGAPIVVIGRHLAPGELPSLYRAVDAYVSPARGEGWGRPLMEAMATGLPVIGTGWGPPLDFMNPNNSLLIEVDRLSVVDGQMEVAAHQGQRWAEPSTDHLVELLRHVHTNPGAARAVGQRARRDIEQHWHWRRIAGIAAERLAHIATELRHGAGVVTW
ncbi:MAG: glycosyltransferase [Actinomycetota bacterium]|nr:glycosyltransferase [Actinomycetota bacterium]